jgi:hypothetical protein
MLYKRASDLAKNRTMFFQLYLMILTTYWPYDYIESFHDQGAHFTRDVIVEV